MPLAPQRRGHAAINIRQRVRLREARVEQAVVGGEEAVVVGGRVPLQHPRGVPPLPHVAAEERQDHRTWGLKTGETRGKVRRGLDWGRKEAGW